MSKLRHTVLHDQHLALGARMVAFGGWHMPVSYSMGTIAEHLTVRSTAGLFDVSHMGRFSISGADAVPFLQYVLTNNVEAPDVEESQYTIIPNAVGGAIDDAYLYRFGENEFLLVVNAANRDQDWDHFQQHAGQFDAVTRADRTDGLAMFALQGPESKSVLEQVISTGQLPEPMRNKLSTVTIAGIEVGVSRTGYTGEPLGFELFVDREQASVLWTKLTDNGATPVGLGARDTLRLEAAFPLYGHEFGRDPEGNEIPIFASPIAKGPGLADRLERNNILCNFQATPDQEGFTASGGLRMGVAEMTRFGMRPDDFAALAALIAEVVNRDTDVAQQVKALRGKFLDVQYCFRDSEALEALHKLL